MSSTAERGGYRVDNAASLDALDFGTDLIPVVAQHAHTGEVLMLAYASRAALENTLRDGVVWFYSRSREELWRKGDTSGNVLRLVSLHADCDRDAVLALVEPAGPACHTGSRSCFGAPPVLAGLQDTITSRMDRPAADSYTSRLLRDPNLRAMKLGEEAVELALACAAGDAAAAAEETADLMYHALVACNAVGATLDDVLAVLARRGSAGAAPAQEEAVDEE